MFLNHTQRRSTFGRTPLDEWSARRRDLYLTTHDTHNRQISMPPVGFEPKISAGERPCRFISFLSYYFSTPFSFSAQSSLFVPSFYSVFKLQEFTYHTAGRLSVNVIPGLSYVTCPSKGAITSHEKKYQNYKLIFRLLPVVGSKCLNKRQAIEK